MPSKVSQRQVLAKIVPQTAQAEILPKWGEFRFAQLSGGEITASVEKIYQGGDKHPTVLCAPYEIGDITLTAHLDDDYTESTDAAGLAWKVAELRPLVGQAYYDIHVDVYNCDIQDAKNSRQYIDALLVGITEAEGDASSGAPATFSMTFAIQDVSPGNVFSS
jgi:hypothetical protein